MNTPSHHKFLIAAANSGAGKTTITLGLIKALRNRGKVVQPFKCGPDYIDTKLHTLAASKEAVNLDLYLSSTSHVQELFATYSEQVDVSVVEGVMGLFDGYDKMQGSAAQVSETIDCPIVLVVNAKAAAYSVAPLLYGFKNFYKGIKVVGAIFNFVGSESHYRFLKEACEDVGVVPLGYLPKREELVIPSRHLGLITDNDTELVSTIDTMAKVIEETVDLDALLELTANQTSTYTPKTNETSGALNILVAKDEAFNFMYVANIRALKQLGKVTYFSPLHDKELPADVDFIYLPGGYPELFAKELSENSTMHNSILKYVEAGGKLFAECGGMMYVSSHIETADGEWYPMVGIFNQEAKMKPMKLKLGYRYFTTSGGTEFKGHEFHYSHLESDLTSIVQQFGAKHQEVDTKLLRYKNALAGYTHLYWGEKANILDLFK